MFKKKRIFNLNDLKQYISKTTQKVHIRPLLPPLGGISVYFYKLGLKQKKIQIKKI